MDEHPQIHFSDSFEKVLKTNAEKFSCLAKTHESAQRLTATYNTYLVIPTIILSGLAGLGAVGSDSLLPFDGSQTLVGMVSFICATLQTIASYLAFAKRSEAHRNASIQYYKLHQLISLELSLPRRERMTASKLMEMVKEEAGRLLETAPQLPSVTIKEFQAKFSSQTSVSIPLSLNGLEEVKIAEEIAIPSLTPLAATERPKVKIMEQKPNLLAV
jgi:hypothetical protein